MDLGLKGRKAIVCASSRGLGKACAMALAQEGAELVINGLDAAHLEAAADEIRTATGTKVTAIRADITTDDGRAALLAACAEPDILVTNNAGPPPGKVQDWDRADWISAIDSNMIPAALLIKAVLPGMRQRKFGRIVNITASVVKSPKFPEMALSSASRSALTSLSKALSREVAADNVTINNLLPERIDTDRQKMQAERIAKEQGISVDAARAKFTAALPAKRFGRPEEFGAACAFLCGGLSGFITGQSLLLDGGASESIV